MSITKLERTEPEIAAMAKHLRARIIYRPGRPGYYRMILGSSDWQLTGWQFDQDNKLMGEAENIEAAKRKMRKAIDARTEWGTLRQRGQHVLDLMKDQIKDYRPEYFNHVYQLGGDSASCFASYYPRAAAMIGISKSEWDKKEKADTHSVWIDLIGKDQVEFKAANFDDAIAKAQEWVNGLDDSATTAEHAFEWAQQTQEAKQ